MSPVTVMRDPDDRSQGYVEVPCGKCYACLRNRTNEWCFRLNVELRYSLCACFLTLTYDDLHLPDDRSLHYEHVQRFYKRLRKHVRFRHFTIGEYGPSFDRPHYHAILFGLSWADELLLREKWPYGFIKLGNVTAASINYVAGYCCKPQHDFEADGVKPPFTCCSLKPAIGYQYIDRAFDLLASQRVCVSKRDGFTSRIPRYYEKKVLQMLTSHEINDDKKKVYQKIIRESWSDERRQHSRLDSCPFPRGDPRRYDWLHAQVLRENSYRLNGLRKLQNKFSKRKPL